jgi:hypothetical protein
MTRLRLIGIAGVAIAVLVVTRAATRPVAPPPDRLSNPEFWGMVTEFSEPGGYFRSANITNLTSNELWFQHVIPELTRIAPTSRAYLGVGPEQNFTYIAATRPRLAVIFDIRRGNLDLQLLYKAIFELARDRAEFVSMLFSKPRPDGLSESASAAELFAAFRMVGPDDGLARRTLASVLDLLTGTRGFRLEQEDVSAIQLLHELFRRNGFALRSYPTYADLMTADDGAGMMRSFLANEESFRFVKALQSRNLIVPLVGDFAGPKAIREIGEWLGAHGLVVSAFYLSNVEQYLWQDRKWEEFCRNVRALPLDDASTFIRSSGAGRGDFVSSLGNIKRDVSFCGV